MLKKQFYLWSFIVNLFPSRCDSMTFCQCCTHFIAILLNDHLNSTDITGIELQRPQGYTEILGLYLNWTDPVKTNQIPTMCQAWCQIFSHALSWKRVYDSEWDHSPEATLPRSGHWFHHSLTLRPWARNLTFLCLSLCICKMMKSNSSYIRELLWGINARIYFKPSTQCLAHTKLSKKILAIIIILLNVSLQHYGEFGLITFSYQRGNSWHNFPQVTQGQNSSEPSSWP